MKIIELNFEDGEVWQIPLEFVAKHRAEYYKSKHEEKGDEKDFDYDEEVKWVMEDDYEGHDWLQNNMDFNDFKDVVKIIPTKPEKKDWVNAEAKIKEMKNNG